MSDTVSPQSRLKRKRARTVLGIKSGLLVALGVSAAVHLSAITLFSVGVWFRVHPVEYYEFDLVRIPADPDVSPPPELGGVLPEAMAAGLPGPPRLSVPDEATLTLPDVDLPALGFANLERLRLREASLQLASRHPDLQGENENAWSFFGRGVTRLRKATAEGLAALGPGSEGGAPSPPLLRIGVPGGAVAMTFQWWSAPYDRAILFSPPIEELLLLERGSLRQSLEFTVRVGSDGRVREVMAGSAATREDLALALLRGIQKYRFAPRSQEDAPDQRGTLVVAPATAAP